LEFKMGRLQKGLQSHQFPGGKRRSRSLFRRGDSLGSGGPNVLRFLWRLMRTAWEKRTMPKAWRRVGGVLIPKEENTVDISQLRPISLMNVEGKVFFSITAQRMVEYLKRN